MKKFATIFIIAFVLCFASCDVMPFRSQTLDVVQSKVYKIYVCGAVENEGYVEVAEGSEWLDCVDKAGYIFQTVMPELPHGVVCDDGILCLRYYDGEKQCDCANLNGALVTERRHVENVSAEVVNKIADFIEQNGKITDRTQLKIVLGQDYAENYYKFFVSESDYEKID